MVENKFTKMVLISESEYAKCKKNPKSYVKKPSLPLDQQIKIDQVQTTINKEKVKPLRRIQFDRRKWTKL